MIQRSIYSVLLAAAALSGSACQGTVSDEPPIALIRNMHFQQRFDSQSSNPFFADGRAMRAWPDGTVPREGYSEDDTLTLGIAADRTGYAAEIPASTVTAAGGPEALVARGQDRYGIYCTPCHGLAGDGKGIVPERARSAGYTYPPPPSFHDDRLRHAPDGQIFATITNGIRNMPSYAAQVPVADRWAIVAYVRALQIAGAGGTHAQAMNGATP